MFLKVLTFPFNHVVFCSIYIKLMKINIYLCEVVVLDHVYFVHPCTDISVDISTNIIGRVLVDG